MEKDTAEVLEVVNFIKDRMEQRFDSIDQRFEAIDERFEAIDERFEAIDRRFDAIDQRFDIMETHFTTVEADLRDIRKRLELLEESAHNTAGYAKEIDHLMQRVVRIETHLGIKQEKIVG